MPKTNRSTSDKSDPKKIAEDHCKEVCLRYSLPALFGNWYENTLLLEVKSSQLAGRLKRGDTFLQKKDIVLDYLYKQQEIAPYSEYLLYDVPIKLRTDLQFSVDAKDENDPAPIQNFTMSTILTDKQIDENQLTLGEGCYLTATENVQRIRKNIFCIISTDPAKSGLPVCYLDDVFIRLYDSGTPKELYLRCEIPHVDGFGMDKHRFLVRLSEIRDRYSKFKLVNSVESLRNITRGHKIPSNTRVLISHVLSNRHLAIELDEFVSSLIMGRERIVSCYNYQDIYKQYLSQNFWIPKTRALGEDARQADTIKEEEIKRAEDELDTRERMKRQRAERKALRGIKNECDDSDPNNYCFLHP